VTWRSLQSLTAFLVALDYFSHLFPGLFSYWLSSQEPAFVRHPEWHAGGTRHDIQAAGRARRNKPEVAQQVDTISSKAASCLHFLKQLKRSGAGRDDLLCFHGAIIRPVLEYACPVWDSSITAAQSKALESIQWRAMRIIFAHDDYMMSLILARLDTLESRRAQLTERFFHRSVLCEKSCFHYLLLDKRDSSVTDRLRHAKTFESIPARTNKFLNSFLPYCLEHFD